MVAPLQSGLARLGGERAARLELARGVFVATECEERATRLEVRARAIHVGRALLRRRDRPPRHDHHHDHQARSHSSPRLILH
jgi:hypothetical protein